MNLFNKLFFFALLATMASSANAQIEAPTFLCVQSDSLFWALPNNTCGPFVSYTAYISADRNGPYTVLATINDPTQVNLPHPNPSGQTWYYYLESDFNCPGQSVLQSDTLDNLSPEVATIQSVSVEGSDVRLNWSLSPSPEVIGYIIYRDTPLGTVPQDTVFGDITTYLDNAANPLTQTEVYYVIPIDACGNSSIFASPHSTMLVGATVDACEQRIRLDWNLYQNWRNGIERQEIWMGIDGATPELLATLSETDTVFVFENALKTSFYSFFVRTYAANSNSVSTSNILSLQPQLVQAVRDMQIQNVSVNPDNTVRIDWTWNPDAEIRELEFLSPINGGDFLAVSSLNPPNPLQLNNSIIETSTAPQTASVSYRLRSTDFCDTTFTSNTANTIFLSGSAQDNFSNAIRWTPYQVEGGVVLSYELYRVVDGVESLVDQFADNITAYEDPVDPYEEKEAIICYYLMANASFEMPDGSLLNFQSRSNDICVQQRTRLIVPNAFAASGINTRFKPVVVFGENINYRMQILDRWGGLLFETADIDEGWTGRKGLSLVPMGAYTYIIRVTQADGSILEETGVVVLVR